MQDTPPDGHRYVRAGLDRSADGREIAEELHYAEGTVKSDIRHINQLWGVENRLQIVLRATELGVIEL